MKLWQKHGLTLELLALGVALTGAGMWFVWPLEPDRWFDILSGLGAGALMVGLMNVLSWGARETVRPED